MATFVGVADTTLSTQSLTTVIFSFFPFFTFHMKINRQKQLTYVSINRLNKTNRPFKLSVRSVPLLCETKLCVPNAPSRTNTRHVLKCWYCCLKLSKPIIPTDPSFGFGKCMNVTMFMAKN